MLMNINDRIHREYVKKNDIQKKQKGPGKKK